MLEKITEILRDYKSDEALTVSPQTTFESLELDSLDFMQLVMNVEDAFGMTVEADASIKTVGDLMSILERENAA